MRTSLTSAGRFAACAIATAIAVTSPVMAQESPAPAAPTASAATPAEREGLFSEPRFITRSIDFAARTLGAGDAADRKSGFYAEMSNMPTGAGWISAGPGYRHWFRGDQVLLDGSAAISWRGYKSARIRLELPALAHNRLFAGTHVAWRDLTQVTYFGDGPESRETDRTEYRLRATEYLGYAGVRPVRWFAIEGQGGYLTSPDVMSQAGFFKRGNPDTAEIFGDDPVFARTDQPGFVFGSVALVADNRDAHGYPTRGGVFRTAMSSYTDRIDGSFSFRRYEGEVAEFVPLGSERAVLAVHGLIVGTQTDAGAMVPFYMAPSLGGGTSLRGYSDFRFHDRNLLLATVEARLGITAHIDFAAFADAGNVAARVRGLDLDKRDYGVGLRVHARQDTLVRLDLAHGEDGWRLAFRTHDPLRLARLSRRTAATPFVQ